MKKWMLISVVMFLMLIAGLALTIKNAIKNTVFSLEMGGVDSNLGSFSDIQNLFGGNGAVTIKFIVKVTNKNWFNIPIRDLESRVYYRGQLIGNSSPSALKNIDISSGSYKDWVEPVDLHLKGYLVKNLLNEIIKGGDPIIEYETEMKVLGIRYTYSDRIQILETALS